MTSELSDRLDNLFNESDASEALETDPPPEPLADADGDGAVSSSERAPASYKESPLVELNAIVLSLDWEITDENLEKLLNQIERLKVLYKDSRLPYMFLQLHGSVGKYIASKKVDAHPDSIRLLHSVHAGLEKILVNPDMNEADKKRILSKEVKKFKTLKHQIMLSKSKTTEAAEPDPAKKTLAPAKPTKPDTMAASPADDRYQAIIEEIKKVIQMEFKELKEEIMSWKAKQ